MEAAEGLGLGRSGGEEQLGEVLIAGVIEAVRPGGAGVFGEAWDVCQAHRPALQGFIDQGLRLTKVRELLGRQTGQDVPYRTLHRFASEELGFGKRRVTVRVEDGKPGEELQVDFGRMGLIFDETTGRKRVAWALILTACYSRHQFVFLSFTQGVGQVIEGFERAWEFFGGGLRCGHHR